MDKKNYIQGLLLGGIAFTVWGLLPLYWRLLSFISPYQIFAQRVVWSLIFVLIIIMLRGGLKDFVMVIKQPKNIINILAPSLFISINWLTYIWGVNNGYVIEASLGYYINPLVLTLLGSIFYKERLNRLQKIGISFAVLGVAMKTITYGRIPYIALILATAFAFYGLFKKKSNFDSLTGLGFETIIIGIPSLIYILFAETSGIGITGNMDIKFWILVSTSGVITAVPLLMYAEGTKKLPLSVVGFLQYIAPTIGLFLGIYVFKEPFNFISLIPFIFIWIGLGFFTYSQYRLLNGKG